MKVPKDTMRILGMSRGNDSAVRTAARLVKQGVDPRLVAAKLVDGRVRDRSTR